MRILFTGSKGQLARAFRPLAEKAGHDITATHRDAGRDGQVEGPHLRLEDPARISAVVDTVRPDWIVHAAALTNVDACERQPDLARRVNALATGALAEAAADVGARMLYVSTDYVFDGARGGYREEDTPAPVQVYGATKLEGEERARRALGDGLTVARTSVVYGPESRNFVTWLVDELENGRTVRIVDDQRASPTLTLDLAEQLLALLERGAHGTFHTAGATPVSRLDLAREAAAVFELDGSRIEPVTSRDMTWAAERPLDSTLDVTRITSVKAPLDLREQLTLLRRLMRYEAPGGSRGA